MIQKIYTAMLLFRISYQKIRQISILWISWKHCYQNPPKLYNLDILKTLFLYSPVHGWFKSKFQKSGCDMLRLKRTYFIRFHAEFETNFLNLVFSCWLLDKLFINYLSSLLLYFNYFRAQFLLASLSIFTILWSKGWISMELLKLIDETNWVFPILNLIQLIRWQENFQN